MLDDNRWSVRMCGVYRCTESHDGTTEDCGGWEGEEKRRERHTYIICIHNPQFPHDLAASGCLGDSPAILSLSFSSARLLGPQH